MTNAAKRFEVLLNQSSILVREDVLNFNANVLYGLLSDGRISVHKSGRIADRGEVFRFDEAKKLLTEFSPRFLKEIRADVREEVFKDYYWMAPFILATQVRNLFFGFQQRPRPVYYRPSEELGKLMVCCSGSGRKECPIPRRIILCYADNEEIVRAGAGNAALHDYSVTRKQAGDLAQVDFPMGACDPKRPDKPKLLQQLKLFVDSSKKTLRPA